MPVRNALLPPCKQPDGIFMSLYAESNVLRASVLPMELNGQLVVSMNVTFPEIVQYNQANYECAQMRSGAIGMSEKTDLCMWLNSRQRGR